MENLDKKRPVLSLTNESFRNYLLTQYVDKTSEERWKYLCLLPVEMISVETWIELHNFARKDLAGKGTDLTGYELVGENLISHEAINSKSWPAHWMWVIQS